MNKSKFSLSQDLITQDSDEEIDDQYSISYLKTDINVATSNNDTENRMTKLLDEFQNGPQFLSIHSKRLEGLKNHYDMKSRKVQYLRTFHDIGWVCKNIIEGRVKVRRHEEIEFLSWSNKTLVKGVVVNKLPDNHSLVKEHDTGQLIRVENVLIKPTSLFKIGELVQV